MPCCTFGPEKSEDIVEECCWHIDLDNLGLESWCGSIDFIDRIHWLGSMYRRPHGEHSRVKRAIETTEETYDDVYDCQEDSEDP